jgi:large subunit ribosomal protein L18
MAMAKNRRAMSLNRHRRLRRQLRGTGAKPRLAVFRSARHIYAQVIDDESARTLAAASTLQGAVREACAGKNALETAAIVGKLIGEQAQQAGIKQVVFDRGGFKYHGRVKSLAEAARESGLEF